MPRRIITQDSSMDVVTSFLLDQRAVVRAAWYRQKYPEFNYRPFLATRTDDNAWADMVADRRMDYRGETAWGDIDAEDGPTVDIATDAGAIFIHERIGNVKYTRGEVIRASQAGINLPTEKTMALNRVFERDLWRLSLFGSKQKGARGLFNNTDIPSTTATSSIRDVIDYAAALVTPSYYPITQYFREILNLVEYDQTNTLFKPSYIGIPSIDYTALQTAVFAGNGGISALDAIEKALRVKIIDNYLLHKNMMDHKDVEPLAADQIIVGTKSLEVAEFNLPMPKCLDTPYTPNGGRLWILPAIMRTGLTVVRQPQAFHIVKMPDYVPPEGTSFLKGKLPSLKQIKANIKKQADADESQIK